MAYDVVNLGVGTDFVSEFSNRLAPAKATVVAEIEEQRIARRSGRSVPLRFGNSALDLSDSLPYQIKIDSLGKTFL